MHFIKGYNQCYLRIHPTSNYIGQTFMNQLEYKDKSLEQLSTLSLNEIIEMELSFFKIKLIYECKH